MLYRLLSSEMLVMLDFFPHWYYDACQVGKLEFESPHLLWLCAKIVLFISLAIPFFDIIVILVNFCNTGSRFQCCSC